MSLYRKTVLSVVLISLIVAATVVIWRINNSQIAGGDNHAPVEVRFQLKWLMYSGFGPQALGVADGIYERAGVDVTLMPGGPGKDPLRLVATGKADVGLASFDQILLARSKGLPIIAISEDTTKSGVGFIALEGSGITTPHDFAGKRVGVMPGTDKGTLYEALMAKLNIDRSTITEIPVGPNLEMLLNGTVDVFPSFITNQPILAEERGFRVNIIDPYQYGIRPGGNVVFTSEETLRTQREDLKRFLVGELWAIRASLETTDDNVVDAVVDLNPQLDRAAELRIWRATRDMLYAKEPLQLGRMDEQLWNHTAEVWQSSGLLPKDINVKECYTNSLVDEIHKSGLLDSGVSDHLQSDVAYTHRQSKLRHVTVSLGWQPNANSCGQIAALELGFYKAQGLDVTFEPGGIDNPSVVRVASGSSDIGIANSPVLVINAVSSGVPLQIVGTIQHTGYHAFFSRAESKIASVEDWRGKRVGIKPGSPTYFLYHEMLLRNGVDRAELHEVPLKYGVQPFVANDVDVYPGALTNEMLVLEELGIDIVILHPEDSGIPTCGSVIFANREYIDQHPEVVKAFVSATMAGWEWCLEPENEAEAIEHLSKHCRNIDRNKELNALRMNRELVMQHALGANNLERLSQIMESMKARGLIRSDIELNEVVHSVPHNRAPCPEHAQK